MSHFSMLFENGEHDKFDRVKETDTNLGKLVRIVPQTGSKSRITGQRNHHVPGQHRPIFLVIKMRKNNDFGTKIGISKSLKVKPCLTSANSSAPTNHVNSVDMSVGELLFSVKYTDMILGYNPGPQGKLYSFVRFDLGIQGPR